MATKQNNDIVFSSTKQMSVEIMRLCSNGDVIVNGKLTTDENGALEGFRLWLNANGYFPKLSAPDSTSQGDTPCLDSASPNPTTDSDSVESSTSQTNDSLTPTEQSSDSPSPLGS